MKNILSKEILKIAKENKVLLTRDFKNDLERIEKNVDLSKLLNDYFKKLNSFKFLDGETLFFNDNGNVMHDKKEFKTSNVNEVHLAIDTGDKKSCGIIILDWKYDFKKVFQTADNTTEDELEFFFNTNKNKIIKKLNNFQKQLKSN